SASRTRWTSQPVPAATPGTTSISWRRAWNGSSARAFSKRACEFSEDPLMVKQVSLMVTCLGDALFPDVGVATVRLLRRLGIEVDFPSSQTCCGQPHFNGGYH